MNALQLDLIDAAGHVNTSALNALPETTKRAVADAMAAGAWVEVRVGFLNNAASIRVGLVNLDGAFLPLAHEDF